MNRQIVLTSRPDGVPCQENFRVVETPLDEPGDGQVLIRHTFLGLAPSARLRMSEESSYAQPLALGDVVYGQAVGEVVKSHAPSLREGDTVMSVRGGWQQYSVAAASDLVKVDPEVAPPSVWLGALGTSGMTAYVGLLDLGKPREGETVVVSAASGGVGAMVGQIARLKGCRVVGIAGGEAKAHHVVETLGFDAGIDYRNPDFAFRLKAACPDGVHVYFENVGGSVRDAVWPLMNQGGRIVVCGLIAEYNEGRQAGPGWFGILAKRLTVRGFIMGDHLNRRDDFLRDMGAWYRAGDIHAQEDVSEGLDSVVPAFIRMLTGGNFGKTVVKL
ncbi:NADP-dependent oxidoreductase [Ramlibacter henchirensis]|uniref:NADP-dependent oxidoreductase n=1 Tax=Ramlibacter henchirensis TaxID=204072 RepID=A0A4Z0BX96_9BURK|nr:NADP-dependent oxidoreductase [Ramlibacter henchirensis]TFZ02898.1 NADP-dependent oxidoreductase [Ramlibacter henchirensis]